MEARFSQPRRAPGSTGNSREGSKGPAVANAVFALTGKRLRRLPLTLV